LGEQLRSDDERGGEESAAHEIAANGNDVGDVEYESSAQGRGKGAPQGDAARHSAQDGGQQDRIEAQRVGEVPESLCRKLVRGNSGAELGVGGVG
jgi:hypothetical protein